MRAILILGCILCSVAADAHLLARPKGGVPCVGFSEPVLRYAWQGQVVEIRVR